jgi:hypothetical protein
VVGDQALRLREGIAMVSGEVPSNTSLERTLGQ